MTVSRRLRFEILRRDGHTCRYCGAKAPEVQLHVDHVIPIALGGTDDSTNLVSACVSCNTGKSSVPADAAIVEDVAADAVRWKHAMERAALEFAAEREVVGALIDQFDAAWQRWTCTVDIDVPAPPFEPTGNRYIDNWHRIMRGGSDCVLLSCDSVTGEMVILAKSGCSEWVRKDNTLKRIGPLWSEVLGFEVVSVKVVAASTAKVEFSPFPAPPRASRRREERQIPRNPDWRESIERFLSNGVTGHDLERFMGIAMAKSLGHSERWRYFCGICWRHITDLQESARRILENEQSDPGPDPAPTVRVLPDGTRERFYQGTGWLGEGGRALDN